MGVHSAAAAGHASPGAAFDYHIAEQERLGLGNTVAVYCTDGRFIGRLDRAEFVRFMGGRAPDGEKLRRPRAGGEKLIEELGMTLPASVVAAMHDKGLLATPERCFKFLTPHAHDAVHRLAAHSGYGRTTNGRNVKGDLYYGLAYGATNRAGEMAPQVTVLLASFSRGADARHRVVWWPRVLRGQKVAQARWHTGVARGLRRHGVTCVPDGNSMRARDYRARTNRSRQMAGALKKTPYRGPRARARAARSTRAKKPNVTWEALRNGFRYEKRDRTPKGMVRRAAKVVVLAVRRKYWEAVAERAVNAGARYCGENAARFSMSDWYATSAHLAMPRVPGKVFDRVFDRAAARMDAYRVQVAATFKSGEVLLSSTQQGKLERLAVAAVARDAERKRGGLTRKQVAKALAGKGLDPLRYEEVQRLALNQGTAFVFDLAKQKGTLRLVAEAYAHRKRDVYVVGKAAGKALGMPAYSPNGLAETLTRKSHLYCLWKGLRSPGSLDQKLRVAEYLRANAHAKLKKGSLVVVDARVTDAKAISRISEEVTKAKGKLILTGEGAREFYSAIQSEKLWHKQHEHKQEQTRGAHR